MGDQSWSLVSTITKTADSHGPQVIISWYAAVRGSGQCTNGTRPWSSGIMVRAAGAQKNKICNLERSYFGKFYKKCRHPGNLGIGSASCSKRKYRRLRIDLKISEGKGAPQHITASRVLLVVNCFTQNPWQVLWQARRARPQRFWKAPQDKIDV